MIVITGATGNLGGLVVRGLLQVVPGTQIAATVRSFEKAAALRELGIELREADYNRPGTLRTAFRRGDKVLLVSAVERGQRVAQHKAVIDAAQAAEVSLIAYTSMLRADTSTRYWQRSTGKRSSTSQTLGSITYSCAMAGTSKITRAHSRRRYSTVQSLVAPPTAASRQLHVPTTQTLPSLF